MAQDTLLGFPAHTLPYRCGEFTTLSTVSNQMHVSQRASDFLWLNRLARLCADPAGNLQLP